MTQGRGGGAHPGAPATKAPLVQRRLVRLGERQGDFVIVASGLDRGEIVVSAGGFRLKDGDSVVVHNDLAPVSSLRPEVSSG
jgi:membrane fusion protein (multidrug efflux system)